MDTNTTLDPASPALDPDPAASLTPTHGLRTSRLDALTAKIARLNRRAVKLGLAPLVFAVLGTRTIFETDEYGEKYPVSITDVSIDGETPCFEGWEFIGAIEHTGTGNILRAVPGHALTEYRTAPRTCGHCNTTRNRKDTFVVEREGARMQVGRSCLKDFLGHGSVDEIVWWAETLIAIGSICDERVHFASDCAGLDVYLSWVAKSVREHGWTSRGEERDDSRKVATADRATYTEDDYYYEPRKKVQPPTAQDVETARAAVAYVLEDTKRAGLNDYQNNIRVVALSDTVRTRQRGIAASIIPYHSRAIEREVERQARLERPSKHFGAVKERLTFRATVTSERTLPGDYGTTWIYTFVTADGNTAKWFASRSQDIKVGTEYSVKGTVKAHRSYREHAETHLSRCKLSA